LPHQNPGNPGTILRRRVMPMACFEKNASINRVIFWAISGINKKCKSGPIEEIKKF